MTNDILAALNEGINLSRLQDASDVKVKHAFFSNYLAALVLLRLQDLKGLQLVNDPSHSKLTKFSSSMSDLNFWGRALFFSKDHEVKNRMLNGHADVLAKEAGRVTSVRIQATMKTPLTSPDQVNWNDAVAALILYRDRFSLQSSYYQKVAMALYKWDKLGEGGRRKAVNDAFMYLMQSDPKSALLPRLRELSTKTMLDKLGAFAMKIVGFKRLNEDGAAGGEATSTGNVASTPSGSFNGIITPPEFDRSQELGSLYKLEKKSPLQVSKKSNIVIKDGKIIKKRVKGFKPRKFKAPDFLHAKASGDK